MKSHKYCPHCHTQLRVATQKWEKDAGYQFLCPKCDENFFRWEVVTLKDFRRKNTARLTRRWI